MNKIFNTILFFAFTLLIISCGGSGDVFSERVKNIHVFPADNEKIWNEIVSIFGDLNFPIKVLEKSSLLIQSEEVNISGEDVYKLTQTKGGNYTNGKMSFTVYLKDKGAQGTEVKIATNFYGYWKYVTYGSTETGVQNLYSNGQMETIIFERINQNIGVTAMPQNKKNDDVLKSSGSGFLLSKQGLVVTNNHVIKDANKIKVLFPEKNIEKVALVKVTDQQNDLAILELQDFIFYDISNQDIPYSFATLKEVKVGQDVFTLGFPLSDVLSKDSKLSTGIIQSLFGIQDDPRCFQINNPIQPGNSGGALFNRNGELVGVCVSSINASYIFKNYGSIPQNVNFAVKVSFLTNLISSLKEGDEILSRTNSVSQGELDIQVEQLKPYIVKIMNY